MGAISGKSGRILLGTCDVLEFREWTLDYGSEPQSYFSRAGAGASQTVAGGESGTGTFVVNIDPGDLIFSQISTGDLKDIELQIRNSPKVAITGKARIGNFNPSAARSGEEQTMTVNFASHGALTFPT